MKDIIVELIGVFVGILIFINIIVFIPASILGKNPRYGNPITVKEIPIIPGMELGGFLHNLVKDFEIPEFLDQLVFEEVEK